MLVTPPDRFCEAAVPAARVRVDVPAIALELPFGQVRLHHEGKLHARLRASTNQSGPRPVAYRRSSARGDSRSRRRWMLQWLSISTGAKPARSSTAPSEARLNRCRWSARNDRYDAPNAAISAASM